MSYIGIAKESSLHLGRTDFGRDRTSNMVIDRFTSDGTIGPYVLSEFVPLGDFNSTTKEDGVDVWVGGAFQASDGYSIDGLSLTFDNVPSFRLDIVVKHRFVKLAEGSVAKRSVSDDSIADDALTLVKMKNQTSDGLLGWGADGTAALINLPGTTDQNKTNIALNKFRTIRNNGLTVQGMIDGIADEFNDETGIDTTTSTNETFVTGYYINSSGIVMNLASILFTANNQPEEAYVVVSHEFIDSGNINSDFVIEASRDNGTTWTTAILTDTSLDVDGTGIKTLSSFIDLSSQPVGTYMKYRIKTANSVEQKFHGVSLQWR